MRYFLTALILLGGVIIHAQTTIVYDYTGEVEQYIVPACVTQLEITLRGAKGGGTNGGNGSTVTGFLDVTEGQILEIRVGGLGSCTSGGYNGGGDGGTANSSSNYGCGGGGASDIRIAPFSLSDRVAVASGGGGMGGGDTDATGGVGGCANGTNGDSPFGVGGFGASATSGGNGGPPWITNGNTGGNGSLGLGGNGASDPCYSLGPGGGGGGGYYGGGGGGSDCFSSVPLGGGGGGGGSSLSPTGFTCTPGNVNSAGSITITTVGGLTLEATPTSPNICQGDSVLISVTGADNYVWTSNIGADTISGSEVWLTDEVTTVYSIIGSNEECADTIDVEVNVGASYEILSTINLCDGESYVLPNGETVDSAGVFPIYFQTINNLCDSVITTEINLIEPNLVELTENICDGDTITLADGTLVSSSGSYTVVLTSLVNGCDSTIITDVIVTPSYNLSESISVCDDGSYYLPDGSSPNSSGTYNFEFQTQFGCDSNIVVDLQLYPQYNFQYGVEICDGENLTLPDGTTVDIEGFYSTMLQTTNGCDSLITIDLVVNPLPDLDIGVESSYCLYDGDITLNPLPSGGILTGDLLSGFVLEHADSSPGFYSVSYTFTDSNGCTSSETIDYVMPEPISPSYDYHISCNDLYLFNSTPDPLDNFTYEWYLNNEFAGIWPELVLEFYENNNYELGLEVTDNYGCSYSILDTMYLHHELDIDGFFMPNVFTPNNDGINETFRIPEPYNTCILYHINIFNKWGDLIYEMHNNTPDFGGYSQNGTFLPEGVYYYTLEVLDYPCAETPELRDWCSGAFSLLRD